MEPAESPFDLVGAASKASPQKSRALLSSGEDTRRSIVLFFTQTKGRNESGLSLRYESPLKGGDLRTRSEG
jgi:hypothetical protein